MATTTTLNRQIKQLNELGREFWVKFNGAYHTNAFESSAKNMYQVSVQKIDGRWFVFAEEHEPEELSKMGFQPSDGFKTLREAKHSAEEFGAFFEACYECE